MTEPIDQATKGIIREEARKFASFLTAPNELEKFHHIHTGYVKGATVWAEKLKQKEDENRELLIGLHDLFDPLMVSSEFRKLYPGTCKNLESLIHKHKKNLSA